MVSFQTRSLIDDSRSRACLPRNVIRSALALDCSRSVQHIARPDTRPTYGALQARSACVCGDSAVDSGVTAQTGATSFLTYTLCVIDLTCAVVACKPKYATRAIDMPGSFLRSSPAYRGILTRSLFGLYSSDRVFAYSKSAVKCARWASSPGLKSSRSNKPICLMPV